MWQNHFARDHASQQDSDKKWLFPFLWRKPLAGDKVRSFRKIRGYPAESQNHPKTRVCRMLGCSVKGPEEAGNSCRCWAAMR